MLGSAGKPGDILTEGRNPNGSAKREDWVMEENVESKRLGLLK